MQEEVYPLKSRRNRSSLCYLSNSLHIKRNSLNKKTNIFSLFYQYIKKMIAQRTIYILGILNLILAGIAIVCVAHAEDHPEYFSLVYISISIFIFYMVTIILIIILQIIETYQEQNEKNRSVLSIEMPLISTQTTPILIENIIPKTSLSCSQTLPITTSLIHPEQTFPISSRSDLLPKNSQTIVNIPKNYQSFALTTNNQFFSPYTLITNSDSAPSLIKPIPLRYDVNNKQKMTYLDE